MSHFSLKNTLIIDGITCSVLFLLCLFGTSLLASRLGLPAHVLLVAGWIGLPSALLMFFVARQKRPSLMLANIIALGNLAWVAASFMVLANFAGQMTSLGMAVVTAQALAVLAFAILEAQGVKAASQSPATS